MIEQLLRGILRWVVGGETILRERQDGENCLQFKGSRGPLFCLRSKVIQWSMICADMCVKRLNGESMCA